MKEDYPIVGYLIVYNDVKNSRLSKVKGKPTPFYKLRGSVWIEIDGELVKLVYGEYQRIPDENYIGALADYNRRNQ